MAKEFTQTTWDEFLIDDARHLIRLAVREDINHQNDWTTVSLVDSGVTAAAEVVPRKTGVAACLKIIPLVIDEMDCSLKCELKASDGDAIEPGQSLAKIEGSARDMLTSERIVLNFLGKLCGIATQTQRYVEAIKGTSAKVYDTRKTTPGWRRLEKFAVRCGGGTNHRQSLDAAVMVKDNHLAFCRQTNADFQISDSVARVRKFLASTVPDQQEMIVEVEVDSLDQLKRVLPGGPDIVLLDNMEPAQLREAVEIRNQLNPNAQLEASGGVTLDSIRDIALTGVERISSGALTHSAVNLDIGLDWAR